MVTLTAARDFSSRGVKFLNKHCFKNYYGKLTMAVFIMLSIPFSVAWT